MSVISPAHTQCPTFCENHPPISIKAKPWLYQNLRSILRFIENVQINDKVRVVISCRPYDLEYDPYLEQFQFGEKVKMDPLRAEIVESLYISNLVDLAR